MTTTDDGRQTVWQIVTSLVDDPGGLDLGPGGQRVVFEGEKSRVTLFHDRDSRLRLIAKAGERVLGISQPIAFNPTTAAADEWRWLAGAQGTYEAFARTVKAGKGACRVVGAVPQAAPRKRPMSPQRLVLENRPSVREISVRYGIPLEIATEVYKER